MFQMATICEFLKDQTQICEPVLQITIEGRAMCAHMSSQYDK